MMITLYGGVNEIGGNKILVEEKDTRVFLDFGTSMGFESDFFSEFLKPRTNTGLCDRLEIGALPKISGIYRKDMFFPSGVDALDSRNYKRVLTKDSPFFSTHGLDSYDVYKEKHGKPFVDALFLSHAHLDHTGAIGFLHKAIDLYCSPVTETLVRAIDDVTVFKSKALISKTNEIGFYKKGMFPGSPKISHTPIERACHGLNDMESVRINDLRVTCIHQDHSVPGAASFLVESDKIRLLYTGDIRFHGNSMFTLDDYVGKIGGSIDVMICEGTRVDSDRVLREEMIQQQITDQIRKTRGLVFIDFSWKDTTRYETIKKAAEHAGRTFVINARLAFLLKQLGQYPSDEENIQVFLKRKDSCLYAPSDYNKSKYEYGLSCDWSKEVDDTHYRNAVTAEDVKNHPEQYVMMLSYFDLGQIFDISNDNGKIPGSFFIKAVCAPFSDEMELDEERLIHWLDAFDIKYNLGEKRIPDGCGNDKCNKIRDSLERAHVSGHASRPELKELIEKINPKKVIPVHTNYPHEFEKIVDEIGKNIQVILPEKGVGIGI